MQGPQYQLFFKGMYLFLQYDLFIFLKDIPKVLLCEMGYAETSNASQGL